MKWYINDYRTKWWTCCLKIDRSVYGPHIMQERNGRLLYAKLEKALYGQVEASKPFYLKVRKKLVEWGS